MQQSCLDCSRLSDMYAGNHIKLRQDVNLFGLYLEGFRDSLYSETVLSPPRFNINFTQQVAAHLLRCVVSSFFICCSLQIETIVNRIMIPVSTVMVESFVRLVGNERQFAGV